MVLLRSSSSETHLLSSEALDGEIVCTDCEAALDLIGWGAFHWRLLTLVTPFVMFSAFQSVIISFLFVELSDISSSSIFIASIQAGRLVGMLLTGYISDRFGRKVGLQILFSLVMGSNLACTAWTNVYWIALWQFVMGVGCASGDVVYSLLSEWTTAQHRSFMYMFALLLWICGQIAAVLLAWAILPFYSWQVLLIVTATFFCLAQSPGMFGVLESPRYLFATYQQDRVNAYLTYAGRTNGKLSTTATISIAANTRVAVEEDTSYKSLISDPQVRNLTIIMSLVSTIVISGYYYAVYVTPSYFIVSDSLYVETLAVTLGEIPSIGLFWLIIDRFGRVFSFRVLFLLTTVLWASLSAGSALGSGTAFNVSFLFLLRMVLQTIYSVFYMYVMEVFPTYARTKAVGVSVAAGMFVSIFSTLMVDMSLTSSSLLCAIVFLVGMFLSLLVTIETANCPLPEDMRLEIEVKPHKKDTEMKTTNPLDDNNIQV